jgi:hypothetical protein
MPLPLPLSDCFECIIAADTIPWESEVIISAVCNGYLIIAKETTNIYTKKKEKKMYLYSLKL